MTMFVASLCLLWCLCAAQRNEISQPDSLQTVKLGDSATIQCYIQSKMIKRVWYKLTAGRRLQLVASFDTFYNRSVLTDEFQHRFSVKFDSISSHLSISETSWDDAGTYFCGVMFLNNIQFGSGTFLMLKGAKMISDSVVQRPESQSVRSGDSVTLSCSVHSDQCDAEHTSVMWLKKSHQSAAEMIHSPGNDSCRRTEGGGTSCVYHLLMRNISSEDAGIYYCAVTSCGRVLFGNGTMLIVEYDNSVNSRASTLIIILGVYVAFLVFILSKRNCCHCPGSHAGLSAPSTDSAQAQDKEHIIIKRSKRPRDDTWTECVYLSGKKSN